MTSDPDRYWIPAGRAETQLVEKRSRFLAVALPVFTREEAQAVWEAERVRFHDAAHHCYAWRVGEQERSSDDGEPAGTAGKPILSAIGHSELDSVAVVVTRYFGGVKLGPGGLVRAYGDAAGQALAQAGRQECFRTGRVSVAFDFDLTSRVHHTVQKFEARTVESTYSERTRLVLELRRSRVAPFQSALLEATAGKVEIRDE